jgi:IS4 transposase
LNNFRQLLQKSGYVSYKKFDDYYEQDILFASRLKKNALVEVIKEHPLRPDSVIKKDRTVILGKEGTTKMHHPLRCVETEDQEGNAIVIVTNAFKQSAEEIGDIYRYRWQIELTDFLYSRVLKACLNNLHGCGPGQYDHHLLGIMAINVAT